MEDAGLVNLAKSLMGVFSFGSLLLQFICPCYCYCWKFEINSLESISFFFRLLVRHRHSLLIAYRLLNVEKCYWRQKQTR